MPETKNPEDLAQLNKIEITGDLEDFVNNIAQVVEEERSARAWWEQKIDKFTDLRYGIRAVKNHPWPKCANYMIPQIDADINRIKPGYVNLLNVSPIVTFEPYGPEDMEAAKKREKLFDWRMKYQVDWFKNYCLGVDYLLAQGMVIWKVTWKYGTRNYTKTIDLEDLNDEILAALYDARVTDEVLYSIIKEEFLVDDSFEENQNEIERVVKEFREGGDIFELNLLEESDDQVEVIPCSVRDDVVFPINTTDLNEARFIDYIFPITKNDLKIAMRDGKYENFTDNEIDSWVESNLASERKRGKYKTTYRGIQDVIWLHETCVWYDINGDDIEERCICTWPDTNPSKILRFIENPYEHGMWPYVLVKRELNDAGVFASRGIPELDEDFQTGISTAFNQSIDNGTITNTPTVVSRRGAVTNIRNLRYVPGNSIETNGPTQDFEIRQVGNISQQFLFAQAQYLKSWADQRLGNITSGLSTVNNLPGQGQGGNKTKREVDVVAGLQAEIQSLDLQVFQEQMADVYYQADALFEQYGAEEEIFITGEQPIKISRREVQGKFNIVPNGKLSNSNPALRVQKSWMLMQAFINDPDIRQRELKKQFLDDLDINLSQKLFKTDQEIAQEQQQAFQMQEAMKQKTVNEQIGLKHISDMMDVAKQAALVPIEGAKFKPG